MAVDEFYAGKVHQTMFKLFQSVAEWFRNENFKNFDSETFYKYTRVYVLNKIMPEIDE